nr:hypothetical protein [Providencia rettgeri]
MVQLTRKYRGSSNKSTSLPILFCTPHIDVCKLTTPLKEGSLSDEKYFSGVIVPFETEAVKNIGEVISGWVSLSAMKLTIDDIFAMLVALGKLKPEPLNF